MSADTRNKRKQSNYSPINLKTLTDTIKYTITLLTHILLLTLTFEIPSAQAEIQGDKEVAEAVVNHWFRQAFPDSYSDQQENFNTAISPLLSAFYSNQPEQICALGELANEVIRRTRAYFPYGASNQERPNTEHGFLSVYLFQLTDSLISNYFESSENQTDYIKRLRNIQSRIGLPVELLSPESDDDEQWARYYEQYGFGFFSDTLRFRTETLFEERAADTATALFTRMSCISHPFALMAIATRTGVCDHYAAIVSYLLNVTQPIAPLAEDGTIQLTTGTRLADRFSTFRDSGWRVYRASIEYPIEHTFILIAQENDVNDINFPDNTSNWGNMIVVDPWVNEPQAVLLSNYFPFPDAWNAEPPEDLSFPLVRGLSYAIENPDSFHYFPDLLTDHSFEARDIAMVRNLLNQFTEINPQLTWITEGGRFTSLTDVASYFQNLPALFNVSRPSWPAITDCVISEDEDQNKDQQ